MEGFEIDIWASCDGCGNQVPVEVLRATNYWIRDDDGNVEARIAFSVVLPKDWTRRTDGDTYCPACSLGFPDEAPAETESSAGRGARGG